MDPLTPEVLAVMVRLLSRHEMGTMFPLLGPICNMHGPKGRFGCTRPAGHDGLHVAHVRADECCAVWLDDFYHEYK